MTRIAEIESGKGPGVPGDEVSRDEERADGGKVRPLLLGSSALLVQRGLTESLAGRLFLHRCTHWSWPECRAAFGWTLDQWVYYGGYLKTFAQAFADGSWWGRLVENAVGAHLLNGLHGSAWGVTYWRDGAEEVDFVVSQGTQDWAIEVKSGRGDKVSGVAAFRKRYPKAKVWLVGSTGIKLDEFLARPAPEWFR